jgi:hypothetical protein
MPPPAHVVPPPGAELLNAQLSTRYAMIGAMREKLLATHALDHRDTAPYFVSSIALHDGEVHQSFYKTKASYRSRHP